MVERETIDFKEVIGNVWSTSENSYIPTTVGTVHYASDGAHIIPHLVVDTKANLKIDLDVLVLNCANTLLGAVTPQLRAVKIDVRDKNIYLLFYYEGYLDEEELDELEVVGTEFIAGYYREDCYYHVFTTRLDLPAQIPQGGTLVYLRKEENS